MVRRMLFFAAFVAVALFTLGGDVNAAKGEKVPQSPCAFMIDIDKRIVTPFSDLDCELCRCVLKGQQLDVFRIIYSWGAVLGINMANGDCDDSDEQITGARVDAKRWVIVEKDPNGQNPCIRGKEDVFMEFSNGVNTIFSGKGVGVVGVGDPLKGELCCNFDKNQAVIHLTGRGHDSFGGPAPKKKCWARVKYISLINPEDPTNPCSVGFIGAPNPQFVINGVEGCVCDSTFQEPQGG